MLFGKGHQEFNLFSLIDTVNSDLITAFKYPCIRKRDFYNEGYLTVAKGKQNPVAEKDLKVIIFRLGVMSTFLIMRKIDHWNNLPGCMVDFLPLAILNSRLDVSLRAVL